MPQRRVAKPKPGSKGKTKTAGAIVLAAHCGLPQVEGLKADLKRALARTASVTLDASAVTRIDTAALQLLAVFVCERQAKSRGVAWRGIPTCVEAAARQVGLGAALGLDSVKAGVRAA